ncbi:MAG TPA: Rieske 2Fe-2S domain-containing protein [Chloroflexota bacterium]|nr:Rieske 2Fe-2S domain-containing protein [Chloroflexota bacterium]
MLTEDANDTLCRVGPGTPAGELLRRYWMPIAPKAEVDELGLRPIRLLGEDLVVFRDGHGRYGLLDEHCAHRGASLCYGRLEPDGLRCPYHGWKYTFDGHCLEQPAEPADSTYKEHVRQTAYPVQELGGVLFGYLGPPPEPLLPRYDILVREDWLRRIELHPVLDCNWLQPMENAVDPEHVYWLHGYTGGAGSVRDDHSAFELFEYGIYKYHYEPDCIEVHPLVFPNILRGPGNVAHFRIPMDDTHTGILYVLYTPTPNGRPSGQTEVPYKYIGPIKEPYDDRGFIRYRHHMKTFASQDGMAWETQGPLANRPGEHLGSSDEGVVLLRRLLREQIESVQHGQDPIGVMRDPEKNRLIAFKVQEVNRVTGEEIPYQGYERRSFATPISDKVKAT